MALAASPHTPTTRLAEQLAGWVEQGIARVKMKIGAQPARDPERVRAAREAIGADVELFVDANGAYQRKQALQLAQVFYEQAASQLVRGARQLR